MSIDPEDLKKNQEQILNDYDRLREEGKKHSEARQTVMDRWRKTEGWSANKVYILIQQAIKRKVDAETTETTETTRTEAAVTTEMEKGVETTAPTLEELEAKVQRTLEKTQAAGWEWAVAITEIHDSKCYPGAEEKDGWPAYMLARWNIGRSQAFKIVAWVHHEMILTLVPMSPEELEDESQYSQEYSGKPATSAKSEDEPQYSAEYSGSQETPTATGVAPAKPVHATERASRAARTKARRIRGKLNEDDLEALREAGNVVQAEGSDVYLSRKEADRQVKEGDLVKVDDRYYRPGDLTKSGSASETAGQAGKEEQAMESESRGIEPIERGIEIPEVKVDIKQAKALGRIDEVANDYCRGRGDKEHNDFCMKVIERFQQKMKEIEERSKGQ